MVDDKYGRKLNEYFSQVCNIAVNIRLHVYNASTLLKKLLETYMNDKTNLDGIITVDALYIT